MSEHQSLESARKWVLVERVTGYDRGLQIINSQEQLSLKQMETLSALLARRLSSEPLDNIIGVREFYGLEFKVKPDVLSPRPETEILVDYVLGQTQRDQSCKILDLGTGSGAIIISILKNRSNFVGMAVDISEAALWQLISLRPL